MRQLYLAVLNELSGTWRFRWRALIAAWLIAIGGWGFVLSMPNQYEASARVYVDTQSVLTPLLQGLAVQTDVMTKVAMISRELLSRPQLEKVAEETGLSLRATDVETYESLITGLQQELSIRQTQMANLYTITYHDADREMAQRVVQALLDALVEDTLGVNQGDSDRAREFLQAQIDEYEKRLVESEDRLADFKRENVGMMPDERGGYFARLQAAQNAEAELASRLSVATQQLEELRRQIQGEEPVFGLASAAGQTSGVTASEAALAELRNELSRMRLRFTDQHPEVRSILETIAQLEQRAAQERMSSGANPTGLGLQQNLVYQNLQISFNEAQVQVATLRGQLADQRTRVAELRELVDTIPEIEAELGRLDRDYEVTKSQYDTFVRRMESARISEEAEQSSDEIKFRVIDPAVASLQPVWPKRTIFFSGVMAIAVAFGAGLAFVLHQMQPIFSSSKALRDHTGLPVLGVVSISKDAAQLSSERRGNVAWAASVLLLLGAYAVTVVTQDWAVDLLGRITSWGVA